ncbi:hypothetical protein [Roseburia sp. 1XD42-69]|uniref:hypothetical protein n=1 Tax=Roseburia sp. 1XD42-69 TaxID=2320088 RepID=UPI001FA9ABA9|nr:hypothetical protein [Roseburia sp. 1XD42-69]
MAEKKKKRAAEFAKDKNAFAGGSSTKRGSDTKKAKQKQSGVHQPRDADVTSGHDVNPSAQQKDLKSEQSKTFGHDASPSAVQKNLKLRKKPDSGSFQENQNSFQRAEKKTSGQKTMSGQKAKSVQKRRKPGQFQKENSFTGNKEKPDSDNAGSKAQDGFSKEQNTFTEDVGEEQTGETKDFRDDYRRRDTYHQKDLESQLQMAEDAEKMKFIEKNKISLDRLILLNKVSEEEILSLLRKKEQEEQQTQNIEREAASHEQKNEVTL